MEGGLLKFVRGALVAMKGTRTGNLYFLDGSTITRRVIVPNRSNKSDMSRLWHMQLEHGGEKALQTLIKQGVLKGTKTGKIDFSEHCVLRK